MEYFLSLFHHSNDEFFNGKALTIPKNHFKNEKEITNFLKKFGDKKIEEVFLSSNNLTDSIGIHFILNSNLTTLDLSNNHLTKIPNVKLQNLEILKLNQNKIENLESIDLYFPNVRNIELASNKIRTIKDSNVWNLERLQVLQLDDNQLTCLPEDLVKISNLSFSAQENSIDLKQLPKALKYEWKSTKKNWHLQHIPQEIIEGVFLGSIHSAKNKEYLIQNKITHIITVNIMEELYPGVFKYLIVKEEDEPNANLLAHFDECFEFIENAKKENGKVLIHCAAGQSRSATVVIGYVMMSQKMKFQEAYDLVWDSRPCLFVNTGFIKQLKLFSNINCNYGGDEYKEFIKNEIKNSEKILELSMLRMADRGMYFSEISETVTHLNLSYNRLASIDELELLVNLEELNLSNNSLEDISLKLSSFKKLEVLDLSNNLLKRIPKDVVNLIKLKKLILSRNQISEVPPEIKCLESLEVIILKQNYLKDLPVEAFEQMKSLKIVDLTMNKFQENPLKNLKTLKFCFYEQYTQNQYE